MTLRITPAGFKLLSKFHQTAIAAWLRRYDMGLDDCNLLTYDRAKDRIGIQTFQRHENGKIKLSASGKDVLTTTTYQLVGDFPLDAFNDRYAGVDAE